MNQRTGQSKRASCLQDSEFQSLILTTLPWTGPRPESWWMSHYIEKYEKLMSVI